MEFIQAIVTLAIIGFVVYNNLQKEKARSRRRNPARPVPDATVAEPVPATNSEPAVPPPYRAQPDTPRPRKATPPSPAAKPARQPARQAATNAPDKGIRLRTADDARRAFIYSEIFNRKY